MAAVDFEYSDSIDIENRTKETEKLPSRLKYFIEYDKGDSLQLKEHVYVIKPYVEVNTGDSFPVKTPLNKYNEKQYRHLLTLFNKVFTLKDFDRIWKIEELPAAFQEKLETRKEDMQLTFNIPTDLEFEEETLLYAASMEIPFSQVLKLFGKTMPEKEESEIDVIKKQNQELIKNNNELMDMVKQLLAEINKKQGE